MENKNVLVTGGAGYIGSHTCKLLKNNGYNPIVFDNLVYGHKWAVKWGPLVVGDILDSNRLEDVFIKYKPMAVIHFAAYAYVGESVEHPLKYYTNNLSGTISLLQAMNKYDVKNIVFSSTCATYGVPKKIPIDEMHVQEPINPYGKSKLMIEKILTDMASAYNIQSVILRYFNAAGADFDGDIGELHEPETHLIPLVLQAAKGKKPYISVYGNDYDTPDGTCIRDYIHVNDLADAHLKSLEYLKSNNHSISFNLANGSGFSVLDVIETTRKLTGQNININFCKRRKGDPPVLIGDATKANKILGWRPIYGDLERIIESAWAWELKQV